MLAGLVRFSGGSLSPKQRRREEGEPIPSGTGPRDETRTTRSTTFVAGCWSFLFASWALFLLLCLY